TYYLINLLKSGLGQPHRSVQPVVSSEARILPKPVSVSTVFFVFCFSAEHSNNDSAVTQEAQ
ncbi:hypothetical protein ABIE61_003261, partial [Marinobacterium sp. MBR-111]|uniref:hypothetical protein n=1 Tax=Marinobacterium sp. MBR-111 TaxID=3156463 RepID=UPI00339274A4